MKKLPIVVILILFAVLTIVYFRYSLFVPSDAFLTRHQASDLFVYFLNSAEHLKYLGQGFVPFGDYWVPHGGGYPAVPHDQLLLPANLLLVGLSTLTDNFLVSLRIAIPLFYFATLVTAYWYGTVILKRRDASVILAVAYTFSMYGVAQLEHVELLSAQPLVLLTLIFLEKTLASPNSLRYGVLMSVSLLLVYMTQLYPFYFTVVFIGARVTFHLLTSPKRVETLKSVAKTGALFLLMAIPFLLPQLLNMPSQVVQAELRIHLLGVHQPPFLYFLRSTPDVPIAELVAPLYLGLVVVLLFLVPIVLKGAGRMYIFYLLVAVVSLLYAVGQYSPVNIASWVQEHSPLAFFLRAPARVMIIGYLSFAVCAAMGFALLADRTKFKFLLLLVVVPLIFCDLTAGYEPPAPPLKLTQNSAYEFLKEQSGDFRIIEIPTTYQQMSTSSMYTGHDVLSTYEPAYGYFKPLYAFTGIYWKHLQQTATAQEAAFYGVKYVVVNTDPSYYNDLYSDLKYYHNPGFEWAQEVAYWIKGVEGYELVYDKGGYAIYENLLYRGIVFSDETVLQYVRKDPNTIVIDIEAKSPTSIIISQCYNAGWVAKTEYGDKLRLTEVNSIQKLDIPAGIHHITLHYQRYERSLFTFAVFYAILIIILGWMWRRSISHEHN